MLDGEEAELDADTRFALTWFAEHGYSPGPSGDADSGGPGQEHVVGRHRGVRHRARPGPASSACTSAASSRRAGSPLHDERLTVWEATQHLAAALERSESEAAELLHVLGGHGDRARQLALPAVPEG